MFINFQVTICNEYLSYNTILFVSTFFSLCCESFFMMVIHILKKASSKYSTGLYTLSTEKRENYVHCLSTSLVLIYQVFCRNIHYIHIFVDIFCSQAFFLRQKRFELIYGRQEKRQDGMVNPCCRFSVLNYLNDVVMGLLIPFFIRESSSPVSRFEFVIIKDLLCA